MATPERVVYEERTPWPGGVHAMIWIPLFLASVLVLMGIDGDTPREQAVGLAVLFGVGFLVQGLLAGVTVRLFPDRLHVGMGNARFFRSSIRYDRVAAVGVVRYSPLRDFGGWGFRMRPGQRAWTARGNEAVVLQLHDGMEIFIASDHPPRLRERIATVGGIAGPESG